MSGKYSKKKSGGKSKRRFGIIELLLVLVAGVLVFALGTMLLALTGGNTPEETTPPAAETTHPISAESTDPVETTLPGPTYTDPPVLPLDLGQGLVITDIGPYTGAYVEDGSDEVVGDVLMVVLENTSDQALQYAKIILYFADTPAEFTVSTIPAGERVVLLEQSRAPFVSAEPDKSEVYDAIFTPELQLYPDIFAVTGEKGVLRVENISGNPISGEIYVYYKNSAQDIFYGGITYRAKVEGGLEPGQAKEILAAHYNPTGSTILMVTYIP